MTISVTTDLTTTPPRNVVTMSVPSGAVMSAVTLYRNDASGATQTRSQPAAGFDTRVVSDYECPYGVSTTYSWSATYVDSTALTQVFQETWSSLAAWTTVGASWVVSGGKLTWTGADSGSASVSRSLTAGLYRIVLASPPIGLTRINFGGFYLDTVGYKIVAGTASAPFVPGTGAWTIDMTATTVTITTTAGKYSVTAAVTANTVSFVGPQASFTANANYNIAAGYPNSIAVAANGNVFVGLNNSTIAAYSSAGALLATFGANGTGNGQFGNNVTGLAFDSSGNLWASDFGNARVQKFTVGGTLTVPTLTYSAQFGSAGSTNGLFNGPRGLAFDSTGNIYVADTNNNRLQKFTSTGTYTAQVGTLGAANGKFTSPVGVAVDSTGGVFVVDTSRVQKFTTALAYVSTFAQGTGTGQVYQPEAVAVDAGNVLHILTTSSIARFSSAGASLVSIPFTAYPGFANALGVNSTTGSIYAGNNFPAPVMQSWARTLTSVDVTTVSSYGATVLLNETSAAVTLAVTDGWLIHPANPSLSVKVGITTKGILAVRNFDGITNPSNTTLHSILGSSLPIATTTGPRHENITAMTLGARTSADLTALKALFLDETPILINIPTAAGYNFGYGFYSVGDTSHVRLGQLANFNRRDYTIPITKVQPPIVTVANSGWSWAALALAFPKWDMVKAAYATWADVAVNNRRAGF